MSIPWGTLNVIILKLNINQITSLTLNTLKSFQVTQSVRMKMICWLLLLVSDLQLAHPCVLF